MEALHFFLLFFVAATTILLSRRPLDRKRLPPSPPSIPIIGHLHLLRPPRHLSFSTLSLRYGPIVFLRLGSRPAIIVSSPEIVQEIHANNGATFADRPSLRIGEVICNKNATMFLAPYGPHWSNLRRITALELLSIRRLNMLSPMRTEELFRMVRGMVGGGEVELKERLMEVTYNVMAKMVAGKRLYGDDVAEACRFNEILKELLAVMFAFNPRDFFPAMGRADLLGVERRMRRLRIRIDAFASELLEERRREEKAMGEPRGLIDVMLSLQETDPETYTDDIIRGQIMTVLTGGSDTIVETAETTMRILLSHPEIMKKARAEIFAIANDGHLLSESDISQLSYLQCIVKEVMRLSPIMQGHPPHASSKDCTITGYHIPRDTMVFVDVWGIHRDPKLWDDPIAFKPERFEGHIGWRDGYKYFPFGVGRRACPGESLGVRMVMHIVGLLVQCFDWEPMTTEEVDLNSLLGLTPMRSKTMIIKYKVRDFMTKTLSK